MSAGALAAVVIAGACLGLLLWSLQLGYLSPPWLWGLLLLNLLAFLLYRRDKRAAMQGDRRTPENTLHLLAILGGWPGALLAQQLFRHKTSKVTFRIVFWFTVCVNSGIVAWLHTAAGRPHLQWLNRHIDPAASTLVAAAGDLAGLLLTGIRSLITYLEQQL